MLLRSENSSSSCWVICNWLSVSVIQRLDILFYLNQFSLTFGWYTTGVAVYDNTGFNRVRGRDSDFFFILHQRCIFYNLTSPIEVKTIYAIDRFK